ncbi:MAG TPA: DNA-binding response regulator, partial [Myxococcales bacterium]|nr:DNA-binding response regulator [Myxococcales bacterium]
MSRILLVEDDDLIGTMVQLVLRQEGYEVRWQTSGEQAIEAAEQARFDAILLDITLPGMSGIEVAATLRGSGIGVPILMLTSLDSTATKVEALDLGADDYICKPFDMPELLARLKAQIRRSQSGLELPTDAVVAFGAGRIDLDGRRLWSSTDAEINLSDKELDLVSLFVRNPGRVLSRADILD